MSARKTPRKRTPKPRCPACGKALGGRQYWKTCRTENCPLFAMEGFPSNWHFVSLQMRMVADLESYVKTLCYPPAANVSAHIDIAAARQALDATRAEIDRIKRGETE